MDSPVIRVTNGASRDIFIDRDPNWDDQVLTVNGKRLNGMHRLAPNKSAEVSVPSGSYDAADENMMGVIFAEGRRYEYGPAGGYQTTIGQSAETGLLNVTSESTLRQPVICYAISHETPTSMTMYFADIPPAGAASY
ncbi:hypothetical protein LJR230_002509 [Trinickia sp. LjRoot230]|uniref:hypothetical protein n=1 Tax=Trinickia sp. LjRoot230 TaxID=3342288 RepID=UPI003ECDAB4F